MDLVDVEWVDGERNGFRRGGLASVSEVAFEAARPVRRFSSYRGQRHFTGWYWAATTESLVGFESWLERDRAMLLDADRRVVGLSSQPFRLTWPDGRRDVSHTPDYFARLEGGSGLVVDVRPADRMEPRDAEKFSATEAMCQAVGWSYQLAHEPDPVLLSNVRWLAGYRHPRYRVTEVSRRLLDAFAEPAGLAATAELVGDLVAVLPVLYHLVWCGDLRIEWSTPLGDGSLVSAAVVGHG
ncbi:TnsA-like heteromeric transposase endonuclease subunit [Actinomadura harenae]|uniref:TnsA-like heteromeric transposase endonuclease subunit n=1 Tax=Actinomadura harenae TaxID=2483351 RepID=A0A3M2L3Q3_9ACTN|nr:TnsA-like heteromeric transposase endonuclease subunit [Actinomadura harenae]